MTYALPDLCGRTLKADAFHAPVCGTIETMAGVLIAIDGAGAIAAVTRADDPSYARTLAEARTAGTLTELPAGTHLLPGFVDLHVHAPQYPQLGTALDVPLEVWLHKHTFPLEARYADAAFAARVYRRLVADLIANGTTTALYFATVHQDATRILVDVCLELGQRALVGKVAMDHPENCPDDYRDPSVEAALAGTRALIDYVHAHPGNGKRRVHPVITPRFIPACTDATLEGLGALARECGCHVQSHVSESDWEHGYVLARHGMTDAASLDRFGLVGRKTVLAHANFLTPDDMDLMAARGAGVAHCPVSNAYFGNSVFPLRAALAKGVHVGLGTDISGGPIGSIFEAARGAVMASRMLETGVDPSLPADRRGGVPGARIDLPTAFHLATAGAGRALDLPVGLFAPGYRFDAMVIDENADAGTLRHWDEVDHGAGALERIIYCASRANIARVWVDGVAVG